MRSMILQFSTIGNNIFPLQPFARLSAAGLHVKLFAYKIVENGHVKLLPI